MKKPQMTPTASYDVGYRKPPKANQFRKGRTGNPRGKRRGEENLVSAFKRHVLKRIKIRDGDQVRTITLAEAVILKNYSAALQKIPLRWVISIVSQKSAENSSTGPIRNRLEGRLLCR